MPEETNPDEPLVPNASDSVQPAELTSSEQPAAVQLWSDIDIDADDRSESLLPFPVAAMGASKGGLEAYIEILRNLAPDTGMAFVLLPHLSGEHETELPSIAREVTSLPVRVIENGLRPEPNHVYVLPANMRATMQKGVFHLEPRPLSERVAMVIDHFFRSLASDQKNRAIGVVLSGTDSDGALGLRTIKGEGGIAIVQDPESARVEEMPRNSILADHVDLILPPAAIAEELGRLARQFFQRSLQMLEEGNLARHDEPHFNRLLTLLGTVSGIDFRNYKLGTLRRRTARRMMLRRLDSLAEYVRFAHESREELRNLHEDVLINVTRFFRDTSVFDALKSDILPAMFESRPPDQQVRIWIAGCSTGEEAYSIAICILEYLASQPHEPPIQIFGTDASERSIEKARMALYPESIAKEITPERLRRFFVKTDKGYQISKRVRDLCIFARQNLCNDPPFSRLDLISCRNVLIYLERAIQGQIVNTFHYALRSNGCLLLGRSESVADSNGLFTPIDRRNKYYMKMGKITPVGHLPPRRMPPPESFLVPVHTPAPARTYNLEIDLQKAADRIVIARHAPPGVIINEAMDVLEVRGRPAPFLSMAPGTATFHLLRIAHGDIMPILREAVRRSIETGAPVTEDISIYEGPEPATATLEVLPIQISSAQARHYLVLFARASGSGGPALSRPASTALAPADAENPLRELERLRRDITTTRLYLQSLIEERDTRNQELTAAYEEIQSSNEELQSTNEELETAKEELQSTNEELQTVNDELRNRNQALLQASNDLSNLLNSVNIPVVMLGNDLTIRMFTPPAERLMRLRIADVGRPIGEIRLAITLEDIEPLLQEVLDTLATRELDVQDRTGRWYLLRLRPYRTADNKIEGVVLLLLDIDEMKRSQDALEQTRDFANTVVDAVQVPVVVLDEDLRISTANAAFRSLSGFSSADLERHAFSELLTLLWDWPDLRGQLAELVAKRNGAVLELEHEMSRPSLRNFRLVARAIFAEGRPAVLIAIEDVTAQKQAERFLASDRDRLAGQVRSAAEVLGQTREELRSLAGRLFNSQEEERRRVSRELHDDVSQKLAYLEIEIERLRQNPPVEIEKVQAALTNLRDRAGALSHEVRALSHQLHPSTLEHLGLAAALKSLVEEFGERERMVATFRTSSAPQDVPPEVATALYRIAQEALRNAAKHAGRTHVKVWLEGTESGIQLSIRDFGEGFDLQGPQRRGLGFVSMEERARLVGGTLSIESELGHGTAVTVTVPLVDGSNE
jgi:two-component system, chemotaxis family, CheB/CheR fusion protein